LATPEHVTLLPAVLHVACAGVTAETDNTKEATTQHRCSARALRAMCCVDVASNLHLRPHEDTFILLLCRIRVT
jgi:hypothetical protein